MTSSNFIKINGLTFCTKKEACKFYNMNYNAVYQKARRHNLTFNQMLENIANHSYAFIDNGIVIETQADVARIFHISTNSINRYMKRHNMTLQEVYNHYKARELAKANNVHQFRQSFKIKDKIFYSKSDIYKFFHISEATIRYIIKKFDLSFEQAIEYHLNKRNSFFVIDGITIRNQKDIANHFHISRQAISRHMKLYNHDLKQTFLHYKELANAKIL